ncbi:MAG: hypothetical protein GX624_05440 [Actinobacteria bacterium]|nr:hypothetical protein [Actinomycetota bacterium]
MTGYQVASLVAALLVSGPVASVLVQAVKFVAPTRPLRLALAVGVSLAVGVAQAWIAGALPHSGSDLTPEAALAATTAVFVGATGFYRLYFRRKAARRRLKPHDTDD